MRILLVEDNECMSDMIQQVLKKERFIVDRAFDGASGLEKAQRLEYDVMVLDIMLPEKSGFQVISALRSLKINIPILVISARGMVTDRVHALNLGADDYLVKNFSLEELIARIKCLMRRSAIQKNNIFTCRDLTLNFSDMSVFRQGRPVFLARKEFQLLYEMIRQKNKVVEIERLAQAAWGENIENLNPNTLGVHISRLRKKVDIPFKGRNIIKTHRGIGYSVFDRN